MPDYAVDVATIIDNWKTRVTFKRHALTYNDRGEVKYNWTTTSVSDVDIQPINEEIQSYMTEIGIKEISTHIVFGYYDTSDAKLDVEKNDVMYDSSSRLYKIKDLKEYEDSHFELFCTYVEGSGERVGYLLLESGDFFLKEDGDKIWLE